MLSLDEHEKCSITSGPCDWFIFWGSSQAQKKYVQLKAAHFQNHKLGSGVLLVFYVVVFEILVDKIQ